MTDVHRDDILTIVLNCGIMLGKSAMTATITGEPRDGLTGVMATLTLADQLERVDPASARVVREAALKQLHGDEIEGVAVDVARACAADSIDPAGDMHEPYPQDRPVDAGETSIELPAP